MTLNLENLRLIHNPGSGAIELQWRPNEEAWWAVVGEVKAAPNGGVWLHYLSSFERSVP